MSSWRQTDSLKFCWPAIIRLEQFSTPSLKTASTKPKRALHAAQHVLLFVLPMGHYSHVPYCMTIGCSDLYRDIMLQDSVRGRRLRLSRKW